MPNNIFIDTSFVIALINERDQYHEQAATLSYKFESSSPITTDAVILEIGNALAKDFRKEAIEIIKILRGSDTTEVLEVDKKLLEKGFEIYKKYEDKSWGLVDCISFAAMKDRGITEVLTFDSDFEQAGFIVLNGHL